MRNRCRVTCCAALTMAIAGTQCPFGIDAGPDGEAGIETVAGTGVAGFSGDGGPAAEAQLDSPLDVMVRPSGQIVIVDHGNDRIRSVGVGTGLMSTLAGAGGSAADGALVRPAGVFFTEDGTLYVAGWGEHLVYEYPGDGSRAIIAGTGGDGCPADASGADPVATAISLPRSVGVLGDGTVIFAAQGCHRVLRIGGDGRLEAFAGTGEPGYGGDDGPAEDARLEAMLSDPNTMNFGFALSPEDPPDELYIADTANNVIREVNLFTGRIETIAGTGEPGFADGPPSQATFNRPTAVFSSGDHAVWVVDAGNHAIRRIDPLGTEVATVAGTGEPGFNGDGLDPLETRLNNPGGVFVTGDGQVYVADTGNHRIRRFHFNAGHAEGDHGH